MAQKAKVLVAGDVCGKFSSIFGTIKKVNTGKAGPFDMLLCVGQFFASGENTELQPFLDGTAEIPVPTYFICGSEEAEATGLVDSIPDGGLLCKNLTYLGRSGKKNIDGLTISYLSGSYSRYIYEGESASDRDTKYERAYHLSDVEDTIIESGAFRGDGVDVLLTAEWGTDFDKLLTDEETAVLSDSVGAVSPGVMRLGAEISTRYHFAGSNGIHFQLPDYLSGADGVTRFYGMAPIGNKKKLKSLQAFNIPRKGAMTSAAEIKAADEAKEKATANPYLEATLGKPPPPSAAAEEEKPPEPLIEVEMRAIDKKHTDLESGEWICGYCGNQNRKKQKDRCNMRNCDADRFSQHPADQEEIDRRRAEKKLELANAAEKERIMREMRGNKGEKRVSLYAGQAGGLANPSNKKKKPAPDPHAHKKW